MSGPAPKYSIIIPTFNRRDVILGTLESLTRLTSPPGGFEVIIIDDGSPHPLDELVAPYREQVDLTLLRQPNAGPAAARTRGAELARGQFLAFTDDDCQPIPDWLCAFDRVFSRDPDRLLGGIIINALDANVCSATSQLIVDLVYRQFNPTPETATFFCSNNFVMSAARFHELGGFDSCSFRLAAGEDRDFCARWRQRGWSMFQVNEAVIHHFHRMNLQKFWKQCFGYGRGACTFHRLEAARGYNSLVRDSGFHFNLPRALWPLWIRLNWRSRLAALPLLGVWQVANVLGFLHQRRLDSRKNLASGQVPNPLP
ncbi:MAG: glycosyltransferase family 2 protein [Planctomycetaceae bacterium]